MVFVENGTTSIKVPLDLDNLKCLTHSLLINCSNKSKYYVIMVQLLSSLKAHSKYQIIQMVLYHKSSVWHTVTT